MVVLRKIKGSTLMETLVATVLIVVVFMVSSMILNNLFANSIAFNENEVRQELLYLQYQYQNEMLAVPYQSEVGDWDLSVTEVEWQGKTQVNFHAIHKKTNREVELKQWTASIK